MILAEISPGELIDRITILEIKAERIKDPAKLANIRYALASLCATRRRAFNLNPTVARLIDRLREVNGALWECVEKQHLFRFTTPRDLLLSLSLKTQRLNDERAALKKHIDGQFETFRMTEEKSFQ